MTREKVYTDKEKAQFFDAYIEAALWSSVDNAGTPLDEAFTQEDFDYDALNSAYTECVDFLAFVQRERGITFEGDTLAQAGHDFWLTRNHHGAGFWDRPEIYGRLQSKQLTEDAHSFGSADLMDNSDGTVSHN